jgi:hypothetical protein
MKKKFEKKIFFFTDVSFALLVLVLRFVLLLPKTPALFPTLKLELFAEPTLKRKFKGKRISLVFLCGLVFFKKKIEIFF